MTDKALEESVAQATKEFDNWRKTSYAERASLLHIVAAKMRSRKELLAKLITLEMGKLVSLAEGAIDLSADIIDYYACGNNKTNVKGPSPIFYSLIIIFKID